MRGKIFSPPAAGETPDPCHLSGPEMISYTFRQHTPGLAGGRRRRHEHARTHTHTHMHAGMYMFVCEREDVCACAYTYICLEGVGCVCVYLCCIIHTCGARTHARRRARAHTHTHTHNTHTLSLSAQRSWRRSERNSRQRGAQVAGACRTMSRSSIRTWRSWTRRLCRPRPT